MCSINTMDDFESYNVISVIDSGSFGTCYKVKHKLSLKQFVWKAVNYGQMSEKRKQYVVSEVNVLSKLQHPNIIKYYGHIIHKKSSTLYIIMEYCSGGDLSKVLKHCVKTSQCLNENFIWRTLQQIASALDMCYTQCIATVLHRDIKTANVLFDSEYNVKLGDFGLAKILEKKENFTDTCVGTQLEQIKYLKYDKKYDIWALGCLIYEACALKPPFMENDLQNVSKKIKEGNFNRIPMYYSEDLHQIIEFMLSADYICRPTIDVIVRHPTVVLHSCKGIKSIYQPLPTNIHRSTTKHNLGTLFKQTIIIKEENLKIKVTENLQNSLENIRNREITSKLREDKLNERERILDKRVKNIALMERLANEKITRANLYLKRSKDKSKRSVEELDTSFSADPGDTSILPTSVKIDEKKVIKPKGFVRSRSKLRVHFSAQKIFESNAEDLVLKEYNFFKDEPEPIENKNYFKKSVLKSLNNKITQSNSSIGSSSNNSVSNNTVRPLSWTEENKRCAFSLLKIMNSECNKENLRSKITHTKM